MAKCPYCGVEAFNVVEGAEVPRVRTLGNVVSLEILVSVRCRNCNKKAIVELYKAVEVEAG